MLAQSKRDDTQMFSRELTRGGEASTRWTPERLRRLSQVVAGCRGRRMLLRASCDSMVWWFGFNARWKRSYKINNMQASGEGQYRILDPEYLAVKCE